MRKLLLIIAFLPFLTEGQVKVEELRFNFSYIESGGNGGRTKLIKQVATTDTAAVIYPIIATRRMDIAAKINSAIKEEVLFEGDSINVKRALNDRIEEGIIYMDYQIILNQNDILALIVSSQFYGPYISSRDVHLNFDLATGEKIGIDDVVIDRDAFSKIILADKRKALDAYKRQQDSRFKRGGLDSSDFEFNIERANECASNADSEEFLLRKEYLQIFDECDFPHAVRSQAPDYTLIYSYQTISKFIRLRKLLTLK